MHYQSSRRTKSRSDVPPPLAPTSLCNGEVAIWLTHPHSVWQIPSCHKLTAPHPAPPHRSPPPASPCALGWGGVGWRGVGWGWWRWRWRCIPSFVAHSRARLAPRFRRNAKSVRPRSPWLREPPPKNGVCSAAGAVEPTPHLKQNLALALAIVRKSFSRSVPRIGAMSTYTFRRSSYRRPWRLSTPKT
jgi:hypothetical protein